MESRLSVASGDGAERRLSIVRGECVAVSEGWSNVTVSLADGSRLVGDIAVLATGHDAATARSAWHADPWISPSVPGFAEDATVLILGTGLTMADYVLSLLREGRRGPIVAMSRRGLMAKGHRRTAPLAFQEADVPFGRRQHVATLAAAAHRSPCRRWRRLAQRVRCHQTVQPAALARAAAGRAAQLPRACQGMVGRASHRMAPEVEARIDQAMADGQLTVTAAKLIGTEGGAHGARIRYRRRGRVEIESLDVGAIVDCTGIVRDPRATTNPAVRSLFDQGLARPDRLRIGIEISPDCAVVRADGIASQRLFAIGPLTRAAFWEIIAIPDIRNQCAALADQLAQHCVVALPDMIGQPSSADRRVAI